MRKFIYGLIAISAITSMGSCGNSEKMKQEFVQDSLRTDSIKKDSLARMRQDSILQDSIRWTKTSASLNFHGLRGPVQSVVYDVNGKEGQDDPMQPFGYSITVLFDEQGNLNGTTIVNPLNFSRCKAKSISKESTIEKMEGTTDNIYVNQTTFNLTYDKEGRLKSMNGGTRFALNYKKNNIYPTSIEQIPSDEMSFRMNFKYLTFDEHGNWTSCKCEGGGDALTRINVKRTITYYPYKTGK